MRLALSRVSAASKAFAIMNQYVRQKQIAINLRRMSHLMRLDTIVWYRFESPGTPEHTIEAQGSVSDSFKAYMQFMVATRLNRRINIAIARNREDLFPAPTQSKKQESLRLMLDMAAEFDRISQSQSEES